MSHDNLKEELRALIAEISEVDAIPDNVPFKDLGIDSMMGVEIVAAVERQYGIKVDDSELQRVKDLESVVALVVEKMGDEPAAAAG
jgi:acyl carrier protein